MELSSVSIWGVLVALILFGGVFALFSVFDRKLMTRLSRIMLYFVLSLLFVSAYMWGLWILNVWWANFIWLVISTVIISSMILRKAHLWKKSLVLPVHISVFVGITCAVAVGLLLLPQHHTLFIPVLLAMIASYLLSSLTEGIKTYIHSLRHTQEHYQYLLANGATHFEAILPSVRRSVRATMLPILREFSSPLIIAPPMFFCGMLLVGEEPITAVIITFLLTITFCSTTLLTMALFLILSDHFIFDRSGRFLL